jgi:hypothetical protein
VRITALPVAHVARIPRADNEISVRQGERVARVNAALTTNDDRHARASPRPQLRVREGVGRNPSRTQLCDSNLHAVKTGHSELVRAVRSSACPEVVNCKAQA